MDGVSSERRDPFSGIDYDAADPVVRKVGNLCDTGLSTLPTPPTGMAEVKSSAFAAGGTRPFQ